MKQLAILAIVLILSSCGYNIKSDKELSRYQNEVENMKDQMDEFKSENKKYLDSINAVREKDLALMENYKDSVEFMELSRQMCYTTSPHRHSCEKFK